MKRGQIGCPEKSVRNYNCSLRYDPEVCSFQLLRGGSPKSRFGIFRNVSGKNVGQDSSVGIVTGYGLEVRGSNPGGDEIFRTCPDRSCAPPRLLYKGYRVIPGRKAAGPWR